MHDVNQLPFQVASMYVCGGEGLASVQQGGFLLCFLGCRELFVMDRIHYMTV